MAFGGLRGRFSKKEPTEISPDTSNNPNVAEKTSETSTPYNGSISNSTRPEIQHNDNVQHNGHVEGEEKPKVKLVAVLLGAIASMGGMVFGYESGQISG